MDMFCHIDSNYDFDLDLLPLCSAPQPELSTQHTIYQKSRHQSPSKKGHWTSQQKRLYHSFLQIHHTHFQMKQLRRIDKIFKSMSNFIGTRAADQCRSHHQKMQKKYNSFYQILRNLRKNNFNSVQRKFVAQSLENLGLECLDLLEGDRLGNNVGVEALCQQFELE